MNATSSCRAYLLIVITKPFADEVQTGKHAATPLQPAARQVHSQPGGPSSYQFVRPAAVGYLSGWSISHGKVLSAQLASTRQAKGLRGGRNYECSDQRFMDLG